MPSLLIVYYQFLWGDTMTKFLRESQGSCSTPVRVFLFPSVLLIEHINQKATWSRKGLACHRWKPEPKLKAETCKQELRQRPQRNVVHWLTFSHLSYTARTYIHGGMGLPISISNEEHALHLWPQANPKEAVPQMRFLPSSCVKMTAEANCASSFAFALFVIVEV